MLWNAFNSIMINEQVLPEHIAFEKLIADIAMQLAQTKPGQLDAVIDSALQALGRFFRTQRAFLAQFTRDGRGLFHRRIWSAEGIEVPKFFFELDMAAASPWYAGQIRAGNTINTGPDLINLPEESGDLRERLKREGINSGGVVPIRVEGMPIGALGVDTVDQPRNFPPAILDRLRIVADTIGATIVRIESQTELQDSLEKIRQLRDQLEQENIYLREEMELKFHHGEIVGQSAAIKHALGQAEKVAELETTVLITGETGTGKELFARAIHKMSKRSGHSMVTLNCAALPATLIESELFGREKGAFTGAVTRQIGRFEAADQSTLFLDEIGEMPLEIQAKLLRVMQTGQFERLGSNQTVKTNARIITATNRNLSQLCREGRFRKDLFYRLNVFPIEIPPLRERRSDIPLLVWAFVKEYSKTMTKKIKHIPKRVLNLLTNYHWPGNIRELRNVIERAMILSSGATLRVDRLESATLDDPQDLSLAHVETQHIKQVLAMTDWRVSGKQGAAEILGLKPTTLGSRMIKLGIKRPG